ncbi:MAG: MarR family transcriptional regulator [Methanosarcinales archaeon]|nr:MarR family transcriptional regulator [Methanosarcinales archaeon]
MVDNEMLEIINSHREGILQSEIRKLMDIDSKKCSRTVNKLMKDHLIRRDDELADGRKTYRLFPIGFIGPSDRHLKLLAKGVFSPCTGCNLECYPETCYLLNEWVYAVIEEEA